MKKIICLGMLLVFLCGCKGKQPVQLVGKSLSFVIDLTCYNEQFQCEGNVSKDGVLKLRVLYPEDLADLTLTFEGENVTAEYMGLSYTPDCGKMPVGCAASVLYRLLRQSWQTEQLPKQEKKQLYIEGNDGEYWYRFFFSPVGYPLSFEVTGCGISGVFQNITLIP